MNFDGFPDYPASTAGTVGPPAQGLSKVPMRPWGSLEKQGHLPAVGAGRKGKETSGPGNEGRGMIDSS